MKQSEIKVGGVYKMKVSNKMTIVRVDSITDRSRYNATGRKTTRYNCTNLATGKPVVAQSAAKFREEATVKVSLSSVGKTGKTVATVAEKSRPIVEEILKNCPECDHPWDDHTGAIDTMCRRDVGNNEPCGCTETPPDAVHKPVVNDLAAESVAALVNGEAVPHNLETVSVSTGKQKENDSYDWCAAAVDAGYGSDNPPPPEWKPNQPLSNTPLQLSSFASSIVASGEFSEKAPHIEGRALAGTGKTTTAVEGMKNAKGVPTSVIPSPQQEAMWDAIKVGRFDTIRFTAFNSSIASELKDRLKVSGLDQMGCEAATTHSVGFTAVKRAFPQLRNKEVNKFRTSDLVAEILKRDVWDIKKKDGLLLGAVEDLVSLCKQTLSDTTKEDLDAMVSHYDVDMTGVNCQRAYELVEQVMVASEDPNRGGMIDFDDMPWLAVKLGLPIYKTDLLIIDESQDLNRCRQELCKSAGHRLMFIGDKNQAIYGFAGADDRSMDRLKEDLSAMGGCNTFPLTVTRRCGKAIVEEARKIVPDFEAHKSNSEGVVGEAVYTTYRANGSVIYRPWEKTYGSLVRPKDMIVCRVNAPLVSQCFQFLKRGITANIQGRDIGKGLSSLVKKLKATSIKDLVVKLEEWRDKEEGIENAKKRPSDMRLINIRDRADCLTCFTSGLSSVDEVITKIGEVFTDERRSNAVRLSSIHKAKGLEADNVFFLMPDGASCPHPMAKLPWQRQQERNLLYVGITRVKDSLTFVI